MNHTYVRSDSAEVGSVLRESVSSFDVFFFFLFYFIYLIFLIFFLIRARELQWVETLGVKLSHEQCRRDLL